MELKFLEDKSEIDLDYYYSKIKFYDEIAFLIGAYFKIDPWQVAKWNVEKMMKTYSFIIKEKEKIEKEIKEKKGGLKNVKR